MKPFKTGIFELSKEQESTSKMMYGKVVKCIVTPHHSYNQLEKLIPYTETTYVLPERELTRPQLTGFISMIHASPKKGEHIIFTTDMNIITDMVDDCVRVLHEDGTLHDCPCKTFAANIHTIKYDILDSEVFKLDKGVKQEHNTAINQLIQDIDAYKGGNAIPKADYDALESRVEMIGEDIIKGALRNRLHSFKVM